MTREHLAAEGSGATRDGVSPRRMSTWIPAFAGMTMNTSDVHRLAFRFRSLADRASAV
jgi:hypothetical protein